MSWRDSSPVGNTTTRHMMDMMNTARPRTRIPTTYRMQWTTSVPDTSDSLLRDVDCDEVYPRLYVGNEESAKCKKYLKLMGITHVLNTAEGKHFGQVDTNHLYYRDCPRIKYMGLNLIDHPSTDISKYFYVASKFIGDGMASGGKVLVHCKMGLSRSATCAIAYLMIDRKMRASEAIQTVRRNRWIRPNDGFLRQICQLDQELVILRK